MFMEKKSMLKNMLREGRSAMNKAGSAVSSVAKYEKNALGSLAKKTGNAVKGGYVSLKAKMTPVADTKPSIKSLPQTGYRTSLLSNNSVETDRRRLVKTALDQKRKEKTERTDRVLKQQWKK